MATHSLLKCVWEISPDTNGSEILNRLNFADRQAEFAADAAAQSIEGMKEELRGFALQKTHIRENVPRLPLHPQRIRLYPSAKEL